MLAEQNSKLVSGRSGVKAAARLAIERLQTAGDSVKIRPLITDYYKHLKEYRA
jgi:hypothetical protein